MISNGPSTDHCETPVEICLVLEAMPSLDTNCFLFFRYERKHSFVTPLIP